ncbi:MAG: EamA family transporter RarD [Actinomycetota bacterium]|nr:EamA family transporter RarD [Actinomycetota bacterium]
MRTPGNNTVLSRGWPRVTSSRRGLGYGVAAYLLWGLFPLFWPLLKPAGAVEILAHRIVWSLVVVVVILAAQRRWRWIEAILRRPGRLALLGTAAALIGVNWATYIYGVNSGQIVETSLGYFINPLVTVLLGVVVLRERLRPIQWVALAIGTVAVLVLALDYGRVPWIALALAFSFGAYGLIKKVVSMDAVQGLTVETAALFVPALAYLLFIGGGTFTASGPPHMALLASAGLVTAIPLLLFGAAARRLPLSTIGLLQYLSPALQFLLGVIVYGEPMPRSRLIGFALVWVALIVLTVDGLANRQRRGTPAPQLEPVPL